MDFSNFFRRYYIYPRLGEVGGKNDKNPNFIRKPYFRILNLYSYHGGYSLYILHASGQICLAR